MKTRSLTLNLLVGFVAAVNAGAALKPDMPPDTELDAVNMVFARYPKDKKEIWPISGYPRYTPVRPLRESTFASLREYFSSRQQRNVDQFLQSLAGLIESRDRLAKNLGIHEKWWPTGINLLKVDAVLTQDLLTGRGDNPDKISISNPRSVNGKLELTVQEVYTEHGQDRVLGRGHRTSIVTLIRERNRWVIAEIKTTTTDAFGDTSSETLTERLQKAVKPLYDAERAIDKLPQRLEVRKGVKVEN
jgi:hypothetical protein